MSASLPHAFRRRAGRPAIVGHRGVRGVRPENTIAAFEEAIRQGADAFELDVRPCKSGEIVVAHDPTLERTASDPRAVAALTLRELRTIDVGAGERVPTLFEALELARAHGVGVNVEIKYDVPSKTSTVLGVARVLRAWERGHDVVVSSFDPWMLAAHRALVPERCHAAIVHRWRHQRLALLARRWLGFEGAHLEAVLAVPERIRHLSAMGYVGAWTVNEPELARELSRLGLELLVTDTPGALLAAFSPPADE